MGQEHQSLNAGMVLDIVPSHLLGFSQTESLLFITLPDPNPAGASDFVVSGGDWSVDVKKYLRDTLIDTDSFSVPVTSDTLWISLWIETSPGFYEVDNGSGDVYVYRVTIIDQGLNVAEEWDFCLYSFDISSGSAGDITDVNDMIARIAGLLGYRQRVTYSTFDLGIPEDTLVELLNSSDVVIAEYRVKKILNDAHAIIGEIHQWDTSTYAGQIS